MCITGTDNSYLTRISIKNKENWSFYLAFTSLFSDVLPLDGSEYLTLSLLHLKNLHQYFGAGNKGQLVQCLSPMHANQGLIAQHFKTKLKREWRTSFSVPGRAVPLCVPVVLWDGGVKDTDSITAWDFIPHHCLLACTVSEIKLCVIIIFALCVKDSLPLSRILGNIPLVFVLCLSCLMFLELAVSMVWDLSAIWGNSQPCASDCLFLLLFTLLPVSPSEVFTLSQLPPQLSVPLLCSTQASQLCFSTLEVSTNPS